jgi:hypothetical protein
VRSASSPSPPGEKGAPRETTIRMLGGLRFCGALLTKEMERRTSTGFAADACFTLMLV